MGYRTYITRAGYELQAKLFAEGGDFLVTKVEVGRGVCPEGTNPSMLTGLVERMAAATSTKPRREGCEVSLEVEYRSDLNGDLETAFQINEFGVFALGVDGTEILLLYGDLSDYPETAVPQKYGGCVRRYPVNITIGPDAEASLDYPAAAWMTCEEVDAALSTKQPLLAGQPGQVVGFDADGAAVAQDASDLADAVTVPGGGVMELGPELGDGPYTFELEEDGETAVSAAQVSYDGAQSGLQAETVQGAVDALAAGFGRNLADNGGFDIWQRGAAFDAVGLVYTADRWHNGWQKCRYERVDNPFPDCPCRYAMKVTALEDDQWNTISEHLDPDLVKILDGKTVTISAWVMWQSAAPLDIEVGDVSSGYVFVPSNQPQRVSASGVFHADDEGKNGINIAINGNAGAQAGDWLIATGVKLEFGDIATPYVCPDQALELLKCQRYQVPLLTIRIARFPGIIFTNDYVHFSIPIPTSLRDFPTIVNADKLFVCTKDDAIESGFTFAVEGIGPGHVDIIAIKNNHGLTSAHLLISETISPIIPIFDANL